jgi:hypothetical protein
MSHPKQPTIQFIVGDTKSNAETRYAAGVKIAAEAPQSALYAAHADLKASADDVAAKNTALKTAGDAYHAALAALVTARGGLFAATAAWDVSYDCYLILGTKYCTTPADAGSLALTLRGTTHNPLAPPLAVQLSYNAKKDLLRIWVKRAPGMDVVAVQMSTDMTNPALWKELDGAGAVRIVQSPAPGTWWVHACSKTARATSAFTTPVSIVIK